MILVNFTSTYNTFNNNKSSSSPKKVRNNPLNLSALSLLEDIGDLVVIPYNKRSSLFYKLNKNRVRRLRANTLNSNISKPQLDSFLKKKRAPLFTKHKCQVFRYWNSYEVPTRRPFFFRKDLIMKKKHLYNNYLVKTLRGSGAGRYAPNIQTATDGVAQNIILNKQLTVALPPRSTTAVPSRMPIGTQFNYLYKSLFSPIVLKYKYVGKSYRVRYKDCLVFLRFNRAHRTTLLTQGFEIRPYLRKWFRLRFNTSVHSLLRFQYMMSKVRPRNRFTKRGLWSRRALFYKKRGKVSAYR